MNSNKLVIFDLFGVVFTKGLDSSVDHLTAVLNRPADAISKTYRKWEREFDLGEIDEKAFWENINHDLGTSVSAKLLNNIVLGSYQIKAETIKLVDHLRKKIPAVVYSNFRQEWFEALDSKYNVSSHFDKIYISSNTKHLKPDFSAFDCVLNDYNVEKSKIIFLDDEIANVESFCSWGGKGILFHNVFESEIIIRRFLEND
jgi:HAD superfamily hydrolase (TIGR01509 family)